MQNTRIQRWAVLLAENGAKIEYRKGAHNIRADMLSRLTDSQEIAVFDVCEEYVTLENEGDTCSPQDLFDIDNDMFRKAQTQEYAEEYAMSREEGNDRFITHDNILYTVTKPAAYLSAYPRLLLPAPFRQQVMTKVHLQTGHAGIVKFLHALFDVCVWQGIRGDAKRFLKTCAICQVNNSKPQPNHQVNWCPWI